MTSAWRRPGSRGGTTGDTGGICVLYADSGTGKLLGAHILDYQASLLIQPLMQAASAGLGVAEMARGQYWIQPRAERSRGKRPAQTTPV